MTRHTGPSPAAQLLACCALALCAVAARGGESDFPGWRDAPLPAGPMGEAIALGQRLLGRTREAAPTYAGNALNCTSCHLDGGRTPWAAPWVGLWGVFPEYRSRNARINTLADRVNDCFVRSLNGRPLPVESDEMAAILAYMQWVSREVPTGASVPGRGFRRIASPSPPDPDRGERIYRDKCSLCHGPQGQGSAVYPPLWGPQSFNIGAGMARLNTAAAFVKANMPFGQGGTLSDQEAFDVAAFFTRQARPDFAAKALDWPAGGKPADARY
ncbi:MAG TPA: c-type cytochrome [Burkholderiales bacterium]|nr:c-type cytochrome [Burkholderiales bacterium]